MQQLLKYALLAVSLFTGVMALLVLGHLITSPAGTMIWITIRAAAAVFVASVAIANYLLFWRERESLRTPVFAFGVGLTALGAASLVNAYYATLATGDSEYLVILLNGTLFAQGVVTVGTLWWRYALAAVSTSSKGH